jgi:hypothetical protein
MPQGCPPCECRDKQSTASAISQGLLGLVQAAPAVAQSAAQIAQVAQKMKGRRPK